MPKVISVSVNKSHTFSKTVQNEITLIAGEGVEGDAHRGVTVKHRSRVAKDPTQPNLRQVHLIHSELLEELADKGFSVKPGGIGENILTSGIDLLNLSKGTTLHIGNEAIIKITGLRNPCNQLNNFQKGLTQAVLDKDEQGNLIRKAGIMGIVTKGGTVKPEDAIVVIMPPGKDKIKLEPV